MGFWGLLSTERLPQIPSWCCFIGQVFQSPARLWLLLSYRGIFNICPTDSSPATLSNRPHHDVSLSGETFPHYSVFSVWIVNLVTEVISPGPGEYSSTPPPLDLSCISFMLILPSLSRCNLSFQYSNSFLDDFWMFPYTLLFFFTLLFLFNFTFLLIVLEYSCFTMLY